MLGHTRQKREFDDKIAQGQLAHGYIFHGPPRIGKRHFARALASFLEGREFAPAAGVLNDLLEMEAESGSIGIDAVREMRSFLWQKPTVSSRRTVIIDEAESLTDEAQNAILKIAEEPPESALIILVSSDPERFRATVASRFQKVFFSIVPRSDIQAWLEAEHGQTPEEAARIAQKSAGQPGLAYRLIRDPEFLAQLDLAQQFLTSAPADRKELIKNFADDEDFVLADFLEYLLIAGRDQTRRMPTFWHRVFELRRQADGFGLNVRLQLSALAEYLV